MSHCIPKVFTLAVIVSIFAVGLVGAQQHPKDLEQPSPEFTGSLDFRRVDSGVLRGPGTIQYDTGVFTNVGDIPMIPDNFSFGNQFQVAVLPVTVTQITLFAAIVDGSTTGTANAFVTVFGPLNTAGTNAPSLTSSLVSLNANAMNTVALSQAFTGTGSGSFLAGVWNFQTGSTTASTPCAVDCVGFDNNVGPDGFRGMAIEDINGGNFTPITNANAILRATGTNLPVELMTFSIDE